MISDCKALSFLSMNKNRVSGIVDKENEISHMAFQLWEKAGHPEGRDLEFWLEAETRLLSLQKPGAVKEGSAVPKPSNRQKVFTSPFQPSPTNSGARSTS